MFEVKNLPFADNALEPYISQNTLSFHYGKHYQTYISNLNKLVADTDLANCDLETIIMDTNNDPDKVAIFNNAAQVWNHEFYWNSLSADKSEPIAATMALLEKSFGSLEKFKEEFAAAALSQFGSGWAWLVSDGDSLSIVKTSNAGCPITAKLKPLLVIDVWEHAYYLDYQNRRADYAKSIVDNLLNWDFVNKNI
ncbi:MAG: superoxide dismutase [Candidatus Falkowbacteria bacterium]